MAFSVQASPVYFDLAGGSGGSSVTVAESAWLADLTATLAGTLDNEIFTLADGATREVDFFTLTASGLTFPVDSYAISATLAFQLPNIEAQGTGAGIFGTFLGVLSGGTLSWDHSTIPDFFTVNGNRISVDFQDRRTIGLGDTAMVHTYITNYGGAPVPEPGTIVLLGAGLLGLGLYTRRRMIIQG
jgi:hypothetical protein